MTKYFGGFSDPDDIKRNFQPEETDIFPTEEEILYADYGGGGYDGAAIVIFEKDGQLYEVTGSHCSCYGLEGQWGPDKISWKQLAMRPRDNWPQTYDFEPDSRAFIWNLINSHNVPPKEGE
jgi:hypothetical protein